MEGKNEVLERDRPIICDLSDFKPRRTGDVSEFFEEASPLNPDTASPEERSPQGHKNNVSSLCSSKDSTPGIEKSEKSFLGECQDINIENAPNVWYAESMDSAVSMSNTSETGSSAFAFEELDESCYREDSQQTQWKPWASDSYLDTENLMPYHDKSGYGIHATDSSADLYHEPDDQNTCTLFSMDRSGNHRGDTATSSYDESCYCSSSSTQCNSTPTLKMPDLSQFGQDEKVLSPNSYATANSSGSPIHFLNSFFPFTDFSKDPSFEINFDTEFPNRGYVSPTEFLNKPPECGFTSTDQSNSNDELHHFADAGNSAMSSAVLEFCDPWQQFTVEPPPATRTDEQVANDSSLHESSNLWGKDKGDFTYSEKVTRQEKPVKVYTSTLTGDMSGHTQVSTPSFHADVSSLNNTISMNGSTSEPGVNFVNDCVVHLSPDPAEACDSGITCSSESMDSDSSQNSRSINTPPNPVSVAVASGHVSESWARPLPPLHLGPVISQAPVAQPYPTPLSCGIPPLPSPATYNYGPQIPYRQPLHPPGNVIRQEIPQRGFSAGSRMYPVSSYSWHPVPRGVPHQVSSSYPGYYPMTSSINSYGDVNSNRNMMFVPQERPLPQYFGDRETEPVKLVPLPESYPKPYTCQLEWYARNSDRYTAIQPFPQPEGSCRQMCTDQNMKCNLTRKRGAVSIKTKDGKFLCMASDFHTKTVRELLDSAETCKERADAANPAEERSHSPEDQVIDVDKIPDEVETQETCAASLLTKQLNACENAATVSNDVEPSTPPIETTVTKSTPENTKESSECQSEDRKTQFPNQLPVNACSEEQTSSGEQTESPIPDKEPQKSEPEVQTPPFQTSSSCSRTVPSVEERASVASAMCSEPTYSMKSSVSQPPVQPAVYASHLVPLTSSRMESNSSLPCFQPYRGTELIYRGTVQLNAPFNQAPVSTPQDMCPPLPPRHDSVHPLMYSSDPGTGYYGPMLPPRDVQLRTAQPYPLLPSHFSGPPLRSLSHPYAVPHAPAYPPSYPISAANPPRKSMYGETPAIGPPCQMWPGHFDPIRPWMERPSVHEVPQFNATAPPESMPGCHVNGANVSGPHVSRSSQRFGFSHPYTFKSKEQQQGADAQSFKPKHFELASLHIGNFKFTCDQFGEKTAKLKVIFSKKKLIYEFQLNEMAKVYEGSPRQLALVEIPFKSIVQIWGEGQEFKIEVSTPPKVYRGEQSFRKESKFASHLNARYNRTEEDDVTDGEIHHVPYHHIHLKINSVDKLKNHLGMFDERFEVMMRLPFVEEPGKLLPDNLTSQLSPFIVSPSSKAATVKNEKSRPNRPAILARRRDLISGCHCATGCRTGRCSCSKFLRACTSSCQCSNCKNVFNALQDLGVSADEARLDSCLIQNLFKIMNLEQFLKIVLTLTCCGERVTIRQCIPGEVNCPAYPRCRARYKFSWCSGSLCDQSKSPRNHCKICQSCCGKQYRHCGSCNRCYFAGSSGFSCPNCNVEEAKLREATSINMLSDAEIIRNILPT